MSSTTPPTFSDTSTAPPAEKARRVLAHLSDEQDSRYYHGDGFPRAELRQDAAAALAVLDGLAKAAQPFADIGAWLFARSLPDTTPLIDVHGLNGAAGPLTRGHFKAAHVALHGTPDCGAAPVADHATSQA